ncbi:hypothetical protein [Rhizobium terrae]|uniref:hypothetical protein n=1 Tax=Rhizobium terrae TaxID=2171756 RepID=UPI000E3E2257|nr:hypothetical protein [Rhizobium terrae]
MPVILELEDYEANLVVDALVEQRIRLMKNWEDRYRSPNENDGRYGMDICKIGDLAMIDANIDTVYALRERLKEGIMIQRMCHEHALHPEKSVSVAWHHKRGWLPTADFVEKPIEDDQDQMSPGTWTTLPDGVGIDDWMFDITDPEDKIVIASADTQTDGTRVGFYTYELTGRKAQDQTRTAGLRPDYLAGDRRRWLSWRRFLRARSLSDHRAEEQG